jgi:hypothetical protein
MWKFSHSYCERRRRHSATDKDKTALQGMIDRFVEVGLKYGRAINVEKLR